MDSLCYLKLGNFFINDQKYSTSKTIYFSHRKYAPLNLLTMPNSIFKCDLSGLKLATSNSLRPFLHIFRLACLTPYALKSILKRAAYSSESK